MKAYDLRCPFIKLAKWDFYAFIYFYSQRPFPDFRVMVFSNLAHGSLYMLGAYFGLTIASQTGKLSFCRPGAALGVGWSVSSWSALS